MNPKPASTRPGYIYIYIYISTLKTILITGDSATGTGSPATSSVPSVAPVYPNNSTIAITSTKPTGPSAPLSTGAAPRVAGAGAGLAALLGVAAFLL
jgi:hypothetical protein